MKEKIIYVAPHLSSFVMEDITILNEDYVVVPNILNWSNKKIVPILFFKQAFFLLKRINTYEIVVISFGGYWSLIPVILGKVFKKKTYIILNGTDCCALPSLNYGNLRKPILRFITKYSYTYATRLLPVSESLVYTKNNYCTEFKDEVFQGYKAFLKDISTPYTVIPNAIDSNFWKISNYNERSQMTFTTVFSERQFLLKGGDLIVELAKRHPNWTFNIVGTNDVWAINLTNVKFLGYIDRTKLLEVYNNSKYYLQLSVFEGFGCSLCEAILSGCIPIGSNVNAIPEIINNEDFILKRRNIEDLEIVIDKIQNYKLNSDFRQHILDSYNLIKRKEMLISMFRLD